MTDRIPPHSAEAERALIGCVLLDPSESVSKARETFPDGSDWLYDTRWQTVFATVERALTIHQSVDLTRIVVALEDAGKLETVGGYANLAGTMDAVPSAANIGYYLKTLKEKWTLRRFIALGTHLIQDSYEATEVQELADKAEAEILAIARGDSNEERGTYDGERLARAAQRSAEMRFETSQDRSRRILTGFGELDHKLRLRPGNLVILAARPSVGKTSFALNIALNIAATGVPVGFMTLEMTPDELAEQMACTLGDVDSQRFDRGLEESDMARYEDALGRIHKLPMYVEEAWDCNIWRLKQRVRSLKQRFSIQLAIVDYLGLVGGDRKRDNRQEEVGSVSRGLKALAKELQIPVLALCQLNRDIEKAGYRAPRKSDLRESGSIEQDADVIIFLHQRDAEPAQPLEPFVEVIIDKQRRGPTGKTGLIFQKQSTRFIETEVVPMDVAEAVACFHPD